MLIGCSSTYKVSDFPSRDKFYEDFNNSASDKSLKIILNNDSTITVENGAVISNDSLFITLPVLKQEKVINKDDIEDIKVSIHDMTTTIVLKNDKSVTAGSIDILPDSSVAIYNFENTYKYLSLINCKRNKLQKSLAGCSDRVCIRNTCRIRCWLYHRLNFQG